MTKLQEQNILDQAITALGPNSYLGPWLREVRAEVERDIRSDIFPSATLAEAREQAAAILAGAQAEADRIRERAEQAARRTAEQAVLVLRQARAETGRAHRALELAENALLPR